MNQDRLISEYELALQLYQQGQSAAALQKLLKLPPVAEIPFYRGVFYLELNHLPESLNELTTYINAPRHDRQDLLIQALIKAARIASILGDPECGVKHLEHVLRIPDAPLDAFLHWIALAPTICKWKPANQDLASLCQKVITTSFTTEHLQGLDYALLNMHYLLHQGITPIQLATLHRKWGSLLLERLRPSKSSESSESSVAGKSLVNTAAPHRVGIISADFRSHSVGYFLKVILAHLSEEFVPVLIQTGGDHPNDELQEHFKTFEYHDVTTLPLKASIASVQNLNLALALECGGHTEGNALPLTSFLSDIPVISAWGYPNTTGLHHLPQHYRLGDAISDPNENDSLNTEKLLRHPLRFLPWPEFSRPPADARLRETWNVPPDAMLIGSFNALAKLNPVVLAVWNRILKQTENVHLVVSSGNLHIKAVRERFLGYLTPGIDPARIHILEREPDHLRHRQRIMACDLCLDPFPYCGTTTTCETLAMGIPLVTLCGSTHVERTSASLLHSLGLDACISHTTETYETLVVQLLNKNNDKLASLTAKLNEVLSSINSSSWTADFEDMLKNILSSKSIETI